MTDDQLYASAHYLLGLICQLRWDIGQCGKEYEKSYEISRRFGNKEQMAIFLGAMGQFDAAVDNYAKAAERQMQAAELARGIGRSTKSGKSCLCILCPGKLQGINRFLQKSR
jgi:hypothetical protein